MKIVNTPIHFSQENIDKICEIKDAIYVCDTTLPTGVDCSVFYGKVAHPDSNSHYFGLYRHPLSNILYICNASSIEELDIQGVIADDDDIIYSRHRHDYHTSKDGSVWIDGGRDYTRTGTFDSSKFTTLVVRDGVLQIKATT